MSDIVILLRSDAGWHDGCETRRFPRCPRKRLASYRPTSLVARKERAYGRATEATEHSSTTAQAVTPTVHGAPGPVTGATFVVPVAWRCRLSG